VAGERFAVGRPGYRPGRRWRRLRRQAGQDGPEHSLGFAVDGLGVVEADEAVSEQHGQSVHGGPDHELGAGARRGGQGAGAGEPVELGGEHVVRVRGNEGGGLGPAGREGHAGDRRVLHRPADVFAPGHGEVTDTTAIRDVRDYLDYLDYVRRQTARLRAGGASPSDAAAAIEADARARWTTWDYPYWIGLAVRALYQAGLPEGAAT
jgi:hypothetical protein